uniref:Uncharacterized protein n=1 Tax=mine drainage metagenome TaxID=410659 RepID=E6PP82_9ZZZZ
MGENHLIQLGEYSQPDQVKPVSSRGMVTVSRTQASTFAYDGGFAAAVRFLRCTHSVVT